jgi:hypothetical protein
LGIPILSSSIGNTSYFVGKVYDFQIYDSDKAKGTQECNSPYISPPPPASQLPPSPPPPGAPPSTPESQNAVEPQSTTVSGTLQITFGAPACNYGFYTNTILQKKIVTAMIGFVAGLSANDVFLTKYEDSGSTYDGTPSIAAGFTIRVSPDSVVTVQDTLNDIFPALLGSIPVNILNDRESDLGNAFNACVSKLSLGLLGSSRNFSAVFPAVSTSVILRGVTKFGTSEAKAFLAAINDVLNFTNTVVTGYRMTTNVVAVGLLVQGTEAVAAVRQLNSVLPSSAGTHGYVNPALITRINEVGLTALSVESYANASVPLASAFDSYTLQTEQAILNMHVLGLLSDTFDHFQRSVLLAVISSVTNATNGAVGILGYAPHINGGVLVGLAGPRRTLANLQTYNASTLTARLSEAGLPQVTVTTLSAELMFQTVQNNLTTTGVVLASTVTLDLALPWTPDTVTACAVLLNIAKLANVSNADTYITGFTQRSPGSFAVGFVINQPSVAAAYRARSLLVAVPGATPMVGLPNIISYPQLAVAVSVPVNFSNYLLPTASTTLVLDFSNNISLFGETHKRAVLAAATTIIEDFRQTCYAEQVITIDFGTRAQFAFSISGLQSETVMRSMVLDTGTARRDLFKVRLQAYGLPQVSSAGTLNDNPSDVVVVSEPTATFDTNFFTSFTFAFDSLLSVSAANAITAAVSSKLQIPTSLIKGFYTIDNSKTFTNVASLDGAMDTRRKLAQMPVGYTNAAFSVYSTSYENAQSVETTVAAPLRLARLSDARARCAAAQARLRRHAHALLRRQQRPASPPRLAPPLADRVAAPPAAVAARAPQAARERRMAQPRRTGMPLAQSWATAQ